MVRYSAGYPPQQEESSEEEEEVSEGELSDGEPETAELAIFARQMDSKDLILLLLELL